MWETTVMHKQVSGWTVNFGPNFPESPFLELKTRKPPPPPHFRKLGIWDDQSLLWNTPTIAENLGFGMTKVYSGIPPPPFWKTSDLGWPKFTPEYPPSAPYFGKLQIWDDQSLLRNTPLRPIFRKASDLGWPKFTLEYPPPISENLGFGMTKVYSGIPPLRPIFRKASDLGWPKFTLEYSPPPFRKTSYLGWPKFTPEYSPPWKLSESPSPRVSEYRELLHVETLSNPDNY